MKPFMDKDFLLETETARHLFHDYSNPMPLVDYHCHISPKEIYEDRTGQEINLTEKVKEKVEESIEDGTLFQKIKHYVFD